MKEKVKKFLKDFASYCKETIEDTLEFREAHPLISGIFEAAFVVWLFMVTCVKSFDEVTFFPWFEKLIGGKDNN